MTQLELKCGKRMLTIDTADIGDYEILENTVRAGRSETDLIEEALLHPIGSKRLRKLVRAGDRVCLVVSDFTRSCHRTDLFLPYLIRELQAGGVYKENIKLLCALGAHDFQRREEKDLLLGELKHDFTLIEHDCRKEEDLVYVGVSRNGTPIVVSRHICEADKVVLTGSIIYHDMAGFGGGRKSLLPGLAAYDSISRNHLQAFHKEVGKGLNPYCRLGNLENNPMHEDMMDACALIKPAFMFNIVLDGENRYYKAVAGDCCQAFIAGTEYCREACAVPISRKADVVIASCGGYPKDINLYQASKGYAAGIEACKPRGTVLLIADCQDGMGADESVRIITDYGRQIDRELKMRERFVPEAYSGYWMCEMAQHYHLALVTSYPNIKELEKSGITVFRDIDQALKYCYRDIVDPTTYVIPYSMSIVPQIKV